MLFKKAPRRGSPAQRELILKRAMKEIEKLLIDLEAEGKDLTKIKLKKYQKTHHIDCSCKKCRAANQKKDPRLRGLREQGFKVFVAESDAEDIYLTED
ncbi:MAG: hypothetical protein RRB13_11265 [bacterium]|nr:hypothetical protein [bacterium]